MMAWRYFSFFGPVKIPKEPDEQLIRVIQIAQIANPTHPNRLLDIIRHNLPPEYDYINYGHDGGLSTHVYTGHGQALLLVMCVHQDRLEWWEIGVATWPLSQPDARPVQQALRYL